MTGWDTFNDQAFEGQLLMCMDDLNPELKAASDLSWYGMLMYYDSNGVPGDEWASCNSTETTRVQHCVEYSEQNATAQELGGVEIQEPCNYASNLAYYHVTNVICMHNNLDKFSMGAESVRALGEQHAHLGFGSSFWHGSETYLGNIFDNDVMGIASFIMYQVAVENLPNFDDPIVGDLSFEPR